MPGDSCTFSIVLDVLPDAAPGLYANTTSEITATVDGATRTGSPASDTLTVIGAPNLTKSFLDDPVAPGDTVTLEFVLTHPADASGPATDITFTDDLAPVVAGMTANLPPAPDPPCGAGSTLTGSAGDTLLTLMGGTLMPGESCIFSVTLDVPAVAAAGTFTNTSSGVAAMVDGAMATSDPASDDLVVTGLNFSKEFIDDPVIPGETVTLRFTLDNISTTDDATGISFTDNLDSILPGGSDVILLTALPLSVCGGTLIETGTNSLFFSGGSLTFGSPPCSFDLSLQVPAGTADGTYFNTTSNLSAVIGSSAVVLPGASASLIVESNLLSLIKEFTDDPVVPGDPVTLEFTLLNLDDTEMASGIDFTDDLGAALAGLTFDSVLLNDCSATVSGLGTTMITVQDAALGAGGTCTIRVSLTVPGAAAANVYTNTTSAVTGLIDLLPVDGDAASDDLEVVQLLGFSKSFDGPTTATGTATLTFTITNPGSDTANDIS